MATRDQVKQWFETNDYPTQEQFWAWLDSILFSGEVAVADIAGLIELLQEKVDLIQFNSFYKGELINANGNATYQQPANTLIEKVIIIPEALANVQIGTTDGGTEITGEEMIAILPDDPTTQVLVINALALADRTIYFTFFAPVACKIIIFKRPLKTV
jgi:hypothetical protein